MSEQAHCAMCNAVRDITDLDDAMICKDTCHNFEALTGKAVPAGFTITVDEGDEDYTQPHQWFQYVQDAVPGNPSCSGCQLPYENVRHRGRFTATITLHGNDRDSVQAEAAHVQEFLAECEGDVWWEADLTWE